jgi:hypothetical protein
MRNVLSASVVFFNLLAVPVAAEEAVMSMPIQAASLHDGPLDMVAYWTNLDDGGFEVTATFIARTAGAEPMRIAMRLAEGEDVSFGIPGHRSALYRFSRRDGIVDVSVEVLSDTVVLK